MAEYKDFNDEDLLEALRERVQACVNAYSSFAGCERDSFSILHILGLIEDRLQDDVRQGRALREIFLPVVKTMAVMESQKLTPVGSLIQERPAHPARNAALALQSVLLPQAQSAPNRWERILDAGTAVTAKNRTLVPL